MGSTAASASDYHILFFPYMAQGRILHGVTVTILTTPANSLIICSSIDRFNSSFFTAISLHAS
ncbi:hypothetical protein HPP92_000317 [Vanilla planifolia]|uniref:Uncharacterized protein n=1 Tax=Vanilla planifolia TaxID=51239 RepID=A0A835VKC2_VANPL|nr:hypothetical protein HPP92_000292 [Vanilla planifolia]KAG0500245.1 hypothetical protein HPP92_000317 [Vanilla planifolia]